jgi:hypothetical protein
LSARSNSDILERDKNDNTFAKENCGGLAPSNPLVPTVKLALVVGLVGLLPACHLIYPFDLVETDAAGASDARVEFLVFDVASPPLDTASPTLDATPPTVDATPPPVDGLSTPLDATPPTFDGSFPISTARSRRHVRPLPLFPRPIART